MSSPSRRIRVSLGVAGALACSLAACSQPGITSAGNGGKGAAGGSGGSGGRDGSGGFGFDLDALGPPADGGTSAPVPGAPGSDVPSCAAEVHRAQLSPVDLVLLVDTSGSMNESAGAESKWQLARAALSKFWKDPRSAGLGLGLQFFPVGGTDKTCAVDADCVGAGTPGVGACGVRNVCVGTTLSLPARACDPADSVCPAGTTCSPVGRCAVSGGDCLAPGTPCPTGAPGDTCTARGRICGNIGSGSCTAGDYQSLAVPIGALPVGEEVLTRAVTIKEPIGFTPTAPAVSGVLAVLRQHLTANPTHKGVLVILTDGLPLGCTGNSSLTVGASIMAARTATPSILTYAIGVFGGNNFGGPAALDQWAMAGGTGTATVISPTADFAEKLLTTLNTIRGAALPCEFTIPPAQSGTIDFAKVNVRATGAGGATDVPYVGQADRCDAGQGGWYYDVDPKMGTPARVLVCPTTCERFKGDAAAKVDLVFGCATKVIL